MTEIKKAKPFLKWAGGKTQLINDIKRVLPKEITNDKFIYIEPFVGSGAILFWMLDAFPKLMTLKGFCRKKLQTINLYI
jgi:DNA adenine methylase